MIIPKNKPDQPNRGFRDKSREKEKDERREDDDEGKKVDWDQQRGDQAVPERGEFSKINLSLRKLSVFFRCKLIKLTSSHYLN